MRLHLAKVHSQLLSQLTGLFIVISLHVTQAITLLGEFLLESSDLTLEGRVASFEEGGAASQHLPLLIDGSLYIPLCLILGLLKHGVQPMDLLILVSHLTCL